MIRSTALPAALPPRFAVTRQIAPGDFHDCRSVASPFTVHEAARRALTPPGWAAALVRLRHGIVGPLSLRGAPGPGRAALGHLPIHSDTDDALVLGLDDRHLTLRIAVIRDGARLLLSIWVRPHDALGRLWLITVLPLHVLTARAALRRMAGHAVAPLPGWA